MSSTGTAKDENTKDGMDALDAQFGKRTLYLLPEEIMEPEETNVRPFSAKVGDTEAELAAIEALMRSMTAGQLQPIRVKPLSGAKEGEPKYALVAGRRRRRAAMMHNLALSNGDEPMRLEAVVTDEDVKKGEMYRQAAHENLHRASLSPMDFALDIQTVRTKMKMKDNAKVAAYFDVSPATITQHEKLLALDEDTQVKVHRGEISRDDAFRLAKIAEKGGAEAAKAALQAGEAAEKDALAGAGEGIAGAGRIVPSIAGGPDDGGQAEEPTTKKKTATKKAAKARKSEVIRAAAVEAGVKTPRSKKQIADFFTGCLGPVYGYPDGVVYRFATNMLAWMDGEITDRTLDKYFDAMVVNADRGTAASVDKLRAAEEAAAAIKAAAKPTKKPTKKKTAKKK